MYANIMRKGKVYAVALVEECCVVYWPLPLMAFLKRHGHNTKIRYLLLDTMQEAQLKLHVDKGGTE